MIGKGTTGKVYKVRCLRDSKIYALKKIKLKRVKISSYMREIEILKKLWHPSNGSKTYNDSIIKIYKSFRVGKYLYIQLEYADRGDLSKKLICQRARNEFFSNTEIWSMFNQILHGVLAL